MAGRRETRKEKAIFTARLEGRSRADRQRMLAEHRAFIEGRRDTDADDGEETPAPVAVTPPAVASIPAAPRRPPIGKVASYIAHEKRQAKILASARKKEGVGAADGKHGSGDATAPKKVTKKQAAENKRKAKTAKEKEAIACATSVAASRSAKKAADLRRIGEEEARGAGARARALEQLAKKNKDEATEGEVMRKAPGKRKASPHPSTSAKSKRLKKTTPHDANTDEECDDDDESVSSEIRTPVGTDSNPSQDQRQQRVARALTDDLAEAERGIPSDESDEEGDVVDSDDWYIDTDLQQEARLAVEDAILANEGGRLSVEEVVEQNLPGVSEQSLEADAILARERNRATRKLAKERLKASMAKLSRDWKTTTENWLTLTKDEMAVLAQDEAALSKMRKDGWNFDTTSQPVRPEPYPGLYAGEYGPTQAALDHADSPLGLFLFFMPASLWRRIARESNRYYNQHLNERVDRMHEKQLEKEENVTRDAVLFAETKRHKKIKAEEILHCIGLLVARMLCPHARRLVDHWGTSQVGAVPKGTFGRFMSKARFNRVMQNLHFTDNTDSRAETDRAWKVRSVVDTLQRTFPRGYMVPPVLAFDEAMIPSRSRFNVTRQFMKDKPHKWGTKLFMTCCADTAYCLRIEVYCGSNQHSDELNGADPTLFSADPNSGPAAVIRNLHEVLPAPKDGVYYAVVTDRFYTSIQLALQLYMRNVYTVGTIQTNKKGFPPSIVVRDATRPAGTPRGSATIAVAKCLPALQVMLWWDRLPVYLLSTGSSTAVETCGRRTAGGQQAVIPCPSSMRDYHRWMGGVDIHDQLRLQRYSLQLAVRFRKYYKTIFLGLVDMALVNAFIVFREAQKQRGVEVADHAQFLSELQAQLLQVTADDLIDEISSPDPPTPTRDNVSVEHKLTEFPEWTQVRDGIRKRPQHQCKVCSIRKKKVGERSATRFYCEACSDGNKRVYLCDRVRPAHYTGNTMTCHQIWHIKWRNGEDRPRPRVGRGIQMRPLGKKRRRATGSGDEEQTEERAEEQVEEQVEEQEHPEEHPEAESGVSSV